jgi:hypothetical protein
MIKGDGVTDLLLGTGSSLDAVATLDDIGLETDGTRTTVQLEEETTSIAQDRAHLVATP